ncbi:MAG: Mov34/MPN/PAD-1 family protein [Candidatus Thermoplasmatota archaeon]|nr:Mov34/MPN/PAD-1 family protein [Candidatus Thermoplasmatota archaeon]
MPLKKKEHVKGALGISERLLDSIIKASKSTYPNEFGAVLRKNRDGVIDELLMLPGTISGNRHAEFRFYMLHADRNVVGTVHSHPSPYPIPSDADSSLFSNFGYCHIIIAYPYNENSWIAYDRNSKRITLKVMASKQ